jgi:hypothetical protein
MAGGRRTRKGKVKTQNSKVEKEEKRGKIKDLGKKIYERGIGLLFIKGRAGNPKYQ